MRSSKYGAFTVSIPGNFSLETDTLDRAMRLCGLFDGPALNIGGPNLPPVK